MKPRPVKAKGPPAQALPEAIVVSASAAHHYGGLSVAREEPAETAGIATGVKLESTNDADDSQGHPGAGAQGNASSPTAGSGLLRSSECGLANHATAAKGRVRSREECGYEDLEEDSDAYSFEDSEPDSILDTRHMSVEPPSVRSCSVDRGRQQLVARSPRTHLLERHLSEQDYRRSITHVQLRGANNGERYALPGIGSPPDFRISVDTWTPEDIIGKRLAFLARDMNGNHNYSYHEPGHDIVLSEGPVSAFLYSPLQAEQEKSHPYYQGSLAHFADSDGFVQVVFGQWPEEALVLDIPCAALDSVATPRSDVD